MVGLDLKGLFQPKWFYDSKRFRIFFPYNVRKRSLSQSLWASLFIHLSFPLFILLYWRKKISQAPNLAQLNTSKTEKSKNSTVTPLRRSFTEYRRNYISKHPSHLRSVTQFKSVYNIIHLNTWGEIVTLGRSSASKNVCKCIHWQGNRAQSTLPSQNASSIQRKRIRQKNEKKCISWKTMARLYFRLTTDLKNL